MKKNWLPKGIPCLVIIVVLFGYMGYVMGFTNMLNTMMKTAHQLLLNTVFYLMGMCVLTGALGKIFTEFGVVNLMQKALKPVMKPLFNMPGVASLGAILTFLSDNPAIIALSKDRGFARYFKRYQHVSLVNFGTAFGMGLLVIVFMMGQGYFLEPFIGFMGAMVGCITSTRLMQHFTCKKYPNFRTENAISDEEIAALDKEETVSKEEKEEKDEQKSTFVHVLNSLLDGGKDGVTIGLAIIPGVLIISTLVMMLTFGGSNENVDGNSMQVYTGEAFQGTQLLPYLAGKIDFVFKWLFGFTAPEIVSFPITALGAVGAALGLIPEFASKGIIDGNAIAVCTAMGMCWSGYLSTDAATLDSLGYRSLVPKAFLSTFLGGITAGIVTHWLYVGVFAIIGLFNPEPVWNENVSAYQALETQKSINMEMTAYDDSTFTVTDWYGEKGCNLSFAVDKKDSSMVIKNAYAEKEGKYYFVRISKEDHRGEPAYAVFYPSEDYSKCAIEQKKGYAYCWIFVYDGDKRQLTRGYYQLTWGGAKSHMLRETEAVKEEIKQERIEAIHEADSIQKAQLADSLYQQKVSR